MNNILAGLAMNSFSNFKVSTFDLKNHEYTYEDTDT